MSTNRNTTPIKFIALILLSWLTYTNLVAQSYPPVFNVNTLNGANGFAISGLDTNYKLGRESQFIGDINNDGFEDICLSNGNQTVGTNDLSGRAYIILGSPTGFPTPFDLNTLNGTNGFIVEGIAYDERRGSTVAGPGDINGDGIDDLIIGTSSMTSDDIVIYGAATFPSLFTVNDINGTNGFLLDTPGSNQVAALGDVNGDGISDFIIGTPHFSGQAWIVFGRSSNYPSLIDVSWMDGINGFRTSNFPSSRSSYKVGGAGDINNDGINDILIGSWNSSSNATSYALFGKNTSFDPLVDLIALDGTDGFLIDNQGNGFLTFVGSVGDINGDGIDDCFSENNIILGTSSPFPASLLMTDLNGSNGFVLENYVLCAAPTGDLNSDGIADFIVAAADNYVVFGTTGGFPATFNSAVLDGTNGFQIPTSNSNTGRSIDGGKDFNGDGLSDFIFGDSNYGSTGQVYVVFGGDHYAVPLNTTYPQAINETITGFSLLVNGPEAGTIHYAIYPGSFSSTVTHDGILNGTGAVTQGNFVMNLSNTDISEIISSLTANTTYDVYLFLEDNVGNQGEIYLLDDVTTLTSACPYMVPCEERDALIALYNATDGANWNTNTNWLTEQPVDTWFGVTVTGGHVTGIDLNWSGNNLNGTLPIELGDLNFLERFIMPYNPNLTGPLVNELFTNLSLIEIDLANNGLIGSIPSSISNLTALQSLELDSNNISGTIPSEIYTLTSLEVLDLYGNTISGPLSTAIQNLTQLNTLSLGSNPIGGVIPTEIGLLTNLTNLNIYSANLTGTIPTEIGNMVNLQYLQLSQNGLTGSIPSSMGNLTQLISLYLSSNSLTGAIPPSLGNLVNVRLFLLGPNQLTGSIPPELGMLTNVESFYLYNNNLSGTIPTELGGLTSVTQLYLSNNQLEGVIPASLATLPNVNDIFFFNNNLSGVFPDFTQAPNLGYRILLENNAFQFGDFENQWNTYQSQLSTFKDSPQAYVNLEETITVNVGSNTTLTTTVSGSQNHYQWYKNNVIISGATASDLILNPTQLTDAGDYYCFITSDLVTDLTLRRHFIHLVVTSVSDTEAPVITCTSDQELLCNTTSIPDYTGLAMVTDNEDPNPALTQNPAAGTAFVDGMTITIVATDASGNTDNCTFIVNTTADTEAPVVTCPSTQNVATGTTIPDYTSLVSATDNCDSSLTIVQSPPAGTTFTNGMTITMTVTDSSNNVGSCTFVINETPDTEAPIMTCPSNQELTCNTTSIPDYTALAMVTDNEDSNPTLTQNPAVGTAFTNGMIITITATDVSNNNSECSFVLNEQSVAINAGIDEDITEGQEVQLNAIATGSGTFLWSPSTGLNNTSISNPIAVPTETTTYTVFFTSIDGCTAEDEITIYVESQQLDETKYGFSPDNDGINEFWKIGSIENYPNNRVIIYNRWGDLVFEIEGYNNTSRVFSGIANKKRSLGADELPEGTYFFDIKIEGTHNLKKVRGFIVLKR